MSLGDDIMAGIAVGEPESVEVPEWGKTLYLHTLTVGELLGMAVDEDMRMWSVLATALRDADGVQVFTAEGLRDMPASQANVIMRLVQKAQALNGMNDLGEA